MKKTLAVLLLLAGTAPASAALLIDDNFDYAAGDNLLGKNSGEATWGDAITSPAQTATHKIVAGNVTVPGLPSPAPGSGSLSIPKNPNSTLTRIPLPPPGPGLLHQPDGTADGPSLFFSFSLQLTNPAYSTGADYFLAGFHWNGQTGGFSSGGAYGYQLHLRPLNALAAPSGEIQKYQLGVSKNNATGFAMVWDAVNTFEAGDSVFVVGEYNFAGPVSPAGTDDIARLWVSQTAVNNTEANSPTAVSTVGPDVNAGGSRLQSFWFRSDNTVPGDLIVDNLRIGTAFSDVTVPEPSTLTLAGVALAMIGLRRRHR